MSIPRKDVRFKLDDVPHAQLDVITDHDGLEIGEWVERLVLGEIERRVHDATVLADKLSRLGKSGNGGDSARRVPSNGESSAATRAVDLMQEAVSLIAPRATARGR